MRFTQFYCKHCGEMIGYTDERCLFTGMIIVTMRTSFLCRGCEKPIVWRPLAGKPPMYPVETPEPVSAIIGADGK